MTDVKIIARGGAEDAVYVSANSKKVLIIEDNSDFLGMIADNFESEGIKAFRSTSGKEGFEIAKKEKPNVIILDVLLEDIDGFEVLSLLKDDPDTHLLPIVIYTNLQNENDKMMSFRLGADGYYLKTETPPLKLVEEIKKIIAKNI